MKGRTDLPLTEHGEIRIKASAKALIGADRLLNTEHVTQIYVSPRQRARRTLELLELPSRIPVASDPDLAEWDYGDYEGLRTVEINERRRSESTNWDIWTDGCPGGESPSDISTRVDRMVTKIREMQMRIVSESKEGVRPCADFVCVAHAHILRAFTTRWLSGPIQMGRHLVYDAGGIGCLGYEHDSFDEPALLVWNVTDGRDCSIGNLSTKS